MTEAQHWLRSPQRHRLLAKIEPLLIGRDDIHLFSGDTAGLPDASASAVVFTRVAPGSEPQFRAWQRRIATAEAAFPGFQGTRLEPPIPGAQDDWATVVRFDSDTHLRGWLGSPQRQTLLDEATTFGAESSVRTVRGGFAGWFDLGKPPDAAPTPIWKQNMVVLLTPRVDAPTWTNAAGIAIVLALYAIALAVFSQFP